MAQRVCPWWLGYWLVNPLRRLVESPTRLLGPLVRPGMRVLEPGCGMGFFTLEVARMVGAAGVVVAVDLQPRMLAGLRRRAGRAGLADRIDARLARSESLGIDDLAGSFDLAVAIHIVHELGDEEGFFAQTRAALKPGAPLLLVEPKGHVSRADFLASLAAATRQGFLVDRHPHGGSDRAALLRSAR